MCVVGHSFVRRLKQEIDRRGWRVEDRYESVEIIGVGGLTVPRLRGYLGRIQRLKPTVVFMDIGTNDMSSPTCDAVNLARAIYGLAREVAACDSVRHVCISEIMRRSDRRRIDFNIARTEANFEMRRLTAGSQTIHMCHYRGLTLNWERHMCSDGVHLNAGGMQRYLMNVRKEVRHWAGKE